MRCQWGRTPLRRIVLLRPNANVLTVKPLLHAALAWILQGYNTRLHFASSTILARDVCCSEQQIHLLRKSSEMNLYWHFKPWNVNKKLMLNVYVEGRPN
ncbi:hypothetical protein B0H14DRAFT_3532825 [Mycena olivaceomarginata]|nr:hypothetical protein B0H14DRAFT_3532825 [Mycena olivaceomarginata]